MTDPRRDLLAAAARLDRIPGPARFARGIASTTRANASGLKLDALGASQAPSCCKHESGSSRRQRSRRRYRTNAATSAPAASPAAHRPADSPRPHRLSSRAAVSPWRSGPGADTARRMRSSRPSANSRPRRTRNVAKAIVARRHRRKAKAIRCRRGGRVPCGRKHERREFAEAAGRVGAAKFTSLSRCTPDA